MLENLINLVKNNAQDVIVNNSAIPNQFNDAAVGDTANGIIEGIKSQVQAGNLGDIMGLLQGGAPSTLTSHPIVSNIITNLAGNFTSKYGVDSQKATGIASALVPTVISQLTGKLNDPNDNSFDLQNIMTTFGGSGLGGMMGGSNNGGLSDTLGKMF